MPRTSYRQRILGRLKGLCERRLRRELDYDMLVDYPAGNPFNVPSDFTLHCLSVYFRLKKQRYLLPRNQHRTLDRRKMHAEIYDTEQTTDQEFLCHYRTTRESFHDLVRLIAHHPVFQSPANAKRKQAKPEYQLLVLLKYLGAQGNAATNKSLGRHFGIGDGTVELYRKRALEAISSLEDRVVYWPEEAKRKEMSRRIEAIYHIPDCVGIVDCTLLPLETKPSLYGEDYRCRNSDDDQFALNVLMVSDDLGRVLYFIAGWPGPVHDNRIWRNCKMNLHANKFFRPKEYLLGDAAFIPGAHMIPAFTRPQSNDNMPPEESKFNKLLAEPLVKSKHCIGLLKGRFPWLKNIRIIIHEKKNLKEINKYIRAAVILHNLLIDTAYEEEWIDEDFLDIDDDDELEDVQMIPMDDPNLNLARREQLVRELQL
jgi:hypothetical protein